MLQLQGLAKQYGPQLLFENVHWQILPRRRYGLVGPNGAGKTTLLRILCGEIQADAGAVQRPKAMRIGYLPQDVEDVGTGPVLRAVLDSVPGWRAAKDRVAQVHERMASDHAWAGSDEGLQALDKAMVAFDQAGGDDLEVRAQTVLGGLGFLREDLGAEVTRMSGGWRMRVALAKLLVQAPEVLLLDEPTNHLDLESLAWFEEFLEDYAGAVVAVSHDRYFLNRIPTHIVELRKKGVELYVGGYEAFLEGRQERLDQQVAAKAKVDRQRAHLQAFVDRFRAKASKAKQAQSRLKMLQRLENVEVDAAGPQHIGLRFVEASRTAKEVLRLEHVRKSWGKNVVYTDCSLTIWRGDKVALVGPNGAGKSTLLKILAGVTDTQGGVVQLGGGVVREHYTQHQLETLDPARSVYEEARAAALDRTVPTVRSVLGGLGFSGQTVDKRIAVLSGGEKARVALARLVLRAPNVLLLDEPTNHLDLTTREVLENALAEFAGTVVLVSHDRYFINAVATRILEVEPGGKTTLHDGDYDAWLYRKAGGDPAELERLLGGGVVERTAGQAQMHVEIAESGQASRADDRQRKRDEAERRQEIARRTKDLRKRLADTEAEITRAEARLTEIGHLQADPGLYSDGERVRAMLIEQAELKRKVDEAMGLWEDLSLRIEGIEEAVMGVA
ncbi:MAG: ABC-F family ATP-binding cassette domain-containing protein [Deltaproteobacteria bacterium]|nr:ABC-F family ATP-binding cassette domain-containing protein [Deltaproteobacteria bacterium]